MSPLFDDRERAEEYGFARAQELRFLAAREGTAAVASWAAERMSEAAAGYAAALVEVLVAGGVDAVAARVRDDLAGAGRHEAADETRPVLDRAIAEAHARLHDVAGAPDQAEAAPATAQQRHGFRG